MPASFISEPIRPVEGGFDTGGMARGEPGLPHKFHWRKKEYVVAEVLERWKEHGDCRHGSGERYVPHVIEPAAGADRATLAFLVDAYDEEDLEGDTRTLLRLHPRLAPVKVAILPLLRKDGQPELAHEIHQALRDELQCEYDEGGSIGRRYRRQDEIGTPWCVTVDHESVADRTVTVRDRDTLSQVRLPIGGLGRELATRLAAPWSSPKTSSS